MNRSATRLATAVITESAIGLIAAGCGGDDLTTSTPTSAEQSAEEAVDSAARPCSDAAQGNGGALGSLCDAINGAGDGSLATTG